MIALTSLVSFSYAQFEQEKKWQISLLGGTVEPIQKDGFYDFTDNPSASGFHRKDMSYNAGLNLSYRVKENFAIRFSFKRTNYNIEMTRDTREVLPSSSSQYRLDKNKAKSSVLIFSPSILWSFKYKMVNPYGGFELIYKKYNQVIADILIEEYDTSNIFVSSNKIDGTQGGGFSFGAGPFIGFSVNISKTFSVGTEISSSCFYYKIGGASEQNGTYTTPTSTTTSIVIMQQTKEGFAPPNIYSSINIELLLKLPPTPPVPPASTPTIVLLVPVAVWFAT